MKERRKRVGVLIKEAIAEIIQRELRDPNLGMVTITGVEMGRDLKKAKVFYSVLGNDSAQKRSGEVLKKAKGFIRRQLAKKITIKFIPELEFEIDQLLISERRVGEILADLNPDAE